MMTAPVVHRLGAIELIELGRSQKAPTLRRPFLANRSRAVDMPPPDLFPMEARMLGARLAGIDFAAIGSFLTGAFEFLFKSLSSIISVPLDLMSSGVGVLFDGLAGMIVNVPIIGVLASQVLLLTKSLIQWGLSLPGLLLSGLGNVFGEIKGAIDATRTTDEKKKDEAAAKSKVLDAAQKKGGEQLKNAVRDAIEGKPPEGVSGVPDPNTDLPAGADQVGGPEKTGLERALEIGLPVAGAATLVFLALS
jgi:hypothetical protein